MSRKGDVEEGGHGRMGQRGKGKDEGDVGERGRKKATGRKGEG